MAVRLVVNGREVNNPVAKRIAGAIAMLMLLLVLALTMFVILPLLGIALGVGLALAGIGLGGLLLGVPLVRRLTTRTTIEPLVPPPDEEKPRLLDQ